MSSAALFASPGVSSKWTWWVISTQALRDPGFQELLDRLEVTLAGHPDIERQFQLALGKA